MQFRIYDRQTLAYKDGGYVASYIIDDDYIVNNNSKINIIKELNDSVVVGDTIVLIETSGAYHKGTITTFDNADLSIKYKSDRELFNDNMLNPFSGYYATEEETLPIKYTLSNVASKLMVEFHNTNDKLKYLPIKVLTDGEKDNMLWNWSNDQINIVDWLIDLFERYKVSLNWTIDFNIAENDLSLRKPQYIVTLSVVTNSGKIIKDNVANQTITYTERELPSATVCAIIDSESKEIIKISSGKNIFNPYNNKLGKKLTYNSQTGKESEESDATSNISNYIAIKPNQNYTFSAKGFDGNTRYVHFYKKDKQTVTDFIPLKGESDLTSRKQWANIISKNEEAKYMRICYYAGSTELQLETGDTATSYDVYDKDAIYYLENIAGVDKITNDINSIYRVLPVRNVIKTYNTNSDNETTPEDVARDTLIPSKFNQSIEIKISADSKTFDFENAMYGDLYTIINEHGTINSNYTGRREESGNKWVTLYFGLGRQNYTDIMQMRMRKAKYQELYNQGK